MMLPFQRNLLGTAFTSAVVVCLSAFYEINLEILLNFDFGSIWESEG